MATLMFGVREKIEVFQRGHGAIKRNDKCNPIDAFHKTVRRFNQPLITPDLQIERNPSLLRRDGLLVNRHFIDAGSMRLLDLFNLLTYWRNS